MTIQKIPDVRVKRRASFDNLIRPPDESAVTSSMESAPTEETSSMEITLSESSPEPRAIPPMGDAPDRATSVEAEIIPISAGASPGPEARSTIATAPRAVSASPKSVTSKPRTQQKPRVEPDDLPEAGVGENTTRLSALVSEEVRLALEDERYRRRRAGQKVTLSTVARDVLNEWAARRSAENKR